MFAGKSTVLHVINKELHQLECRPDFGSRIKEEIINIISLQFIIWGLNLYQTPWQFINGFQYILLKTIRYFHLTVKEIFFKLFSVINSCPLSAVDVKVLYMTLEY